MSSERVSWKWKTAGVIAAALLALVSSVQAVTTLAPDVTRQMADSGSAAHALITLRLPGLQAPAQSPKNSRTATATVQTDRTDYPPDAQVNVTGSGWQPGETVELTFTETEAGPGGYTDGPFTFYAVADEQGNIASGDFHTDQHDLGVTIVLTAKGLGSGLSAQTTFKDGNLAGFFQLDGDASSGSSLTNSSPHDWDQIYSDIVTRSTTKTAFAGSAAINFFTDPVPVAVPGVPAQTEDTFSGGNSKDIYDINQWTYDSSAPQNKANLGNAIAAAYLDPANGHTYLYVGTNRYDNSGSIALGVWFLQSPIGQSGGHFYTLNANGSPNTSSPAEHVDGDLLLVANFGSGGTATITSFTWNSATGTIPSTGTTLVSTIGSAVVNTVALDGAAGHPAPVPWPVKSSAKGSAANFVQAGEFFEAGVDLNLLFPNQTNFNFSSFVAETRASTSPSATLSDFIVGHVSTAPDVTVTKVADNATMDGGSQVGFTITVSNVGVGDLSNVTLTDNVDVNGVSQSLPAGANHDILWSIPAGGNPSGAFVLSGALGAQHLTLMSGTPLPNGGQIAVHIVGTSSGADVGTLTNTAVVAAGNEDSAFFSNNQASATITIGNSGVLTVTPQAAVEGAQQTFQMGSFTSAGTSATVSLLINWGDGSTDTTISPISKPAAGSLSLPSANHTYAEQGTYTVTETVTLNGVSKSGTFTVNVSDPSVIGTAATTISKSYDGLIVGSRTVGTFTDPGGAEGLADYSATVDWGGSFGTTSATITFGGAAGSKTDSFTVTASVPYKDAGTYHPVVTIHHEASTDQQVTDTVTINPVGLTITADALPGTLANDAFSKTYDGQVYSGFTVRYDGFVSGEGPGVLGGTLSFSGAGTTMVNAGGPYAVTPSGQTSSNYTINYVSGSLTINPAQLSITADANVSDATIQPFSKAYNGQVYSPFTVRYSGFVNGETSTVLGGTLSFSGLGTTAVNAGGPYTVTPGGQTSTNYQITFVPGSLIITKVVLTVTINNASFDEGISPTGLGVSITGFVNNETVATANVTGSATVNGGSLNGTSAPGTYTGVSVDVSGLTATNYSFVTGGTGTVTIVDVAPTIVMSTGTITLSAGDGFTRPGSFSDPGSVVPSETWTRTVDYGDGSPISGPTATLIGAVSLSHAYANAGTYLVTVTIADNYGSSSARSLTVMVKAPPTLALSHGGSPVGATAGGTKDVSFAVDGTFSESTNTGAYAISWGDPAGDGVGNPNAQGGSVNNASGTFSGAHTYAHSGTYSVSVTMTDANGDATTKQFALTVN